MGASTTRAACAVALRLEILMRRRRARIALRVFDALRATRLFEITRLLWGAGGVQDMSQREMKFPSVVCYARYYLVIDATTECHCSAARKTDRALLRRLHTCSHAALPAAAAGALLLALATAYSDPYVSAAPAPRRLSAYTNGSADATTKAGGLLPTRPARAARHDLFAAAAPRRAAAPQAYAAGFLVEAAAGQ